jgi:DNA ligase (NAD+)
MLSTLITLGRFINALGIAHVGEETAEDLAQHFGTLTKFREASVEELYTIEGVGEKVAFSIREYFDDIKNQKFVNKLLDNGVKIESPKLKIKNQKLSEQTFVLTGTLSSLTRDDAKEKIRMLGGDITESVSKKTTAVIAGENPGSKYDKAQKLGIKIISEEDFLKLINQ